jgi:hypothetical protein
VLPGFRLETSPRRRMLSRTEGGAMAQPEENQEKTPETDAVLMHPGNDPHREPSQVSPPKERGRVFVERDGEMVPLEPDE